MKALRVLYLWDADYPWDVRTEKICSALTEAGHEVTLPPGTRPGNRRWNGCPRHRYIACRHGVGWDVKRIAS
jgi:hypothetical protein